MQREVNEGYQSFTFAPSHRTQLNQLNDANLSLVSALSGKESQEL